jgi:two-component system cell cycle response regulator CtrA
MRIMFIEQDGVGARGVAEDLRAGGFEMANAASADQAIALAQVSDFDLILLDVGARASASDAVQAIRLAKVRTPILLAAPTDRLVEVVRALSVGADDYVTLPIRRDELSQRLAAVVRETGSRSRQIVRVGKLRIDLERRALEIAGDRVHLTGKEFQMLELLALKRGQTVTKEMFLDHLYGGAYEPVLKIIDVFICKLRKKLTAATGENYIETVWGRGYVMRDPEAGVGALRTALIA